MKSTNPTTIMIASMPNNQRLFMPEIIPAQQTQTSQFPPTTLEGA
jgi:hypothetical protein